MALEKTDAKVRDGELALDDEIAQAQPGAHGLRVLLEAALPGLNEWRRVLDWRLTQIRKLSNIAVYPSSPMTADAILETGAHNVIVATGATLGRNEYPPNVLNSFDVLEEKVPVGQRVVIIGGERMGLVCAEYLAALGKTVTIVEPGKRLGEDVIPTFKWRHAAWVKEYGIQTMTGIKIKEIRTDAVVVFEVEMRAPWGRRGSTAERYSCVRERAQ